jgi:PIN domain
MTDEEMKYDAILVDTSIFDGNGLRLEKGLLSKLSQFKKSPIDLLFPDVIKKEIQSHLHNKIKIARSALEKAFNDAGDHLFFEGSALNDAKSILIDSKEIEGLAESRINQFVEETNALLIECGNFVSVTTLLDQYFLNKPPFAETGKKKNEFPDAIILLAVENWAEQNSKKILAIAKDNDWKNYCHGSEKIDYIDDLSAGLATFNVANTPYALLANLEKAIQEEKADDFLKAIESYLSSEIEWLTPDQDAESFLYWEPEGSSLRFKEFHLQEDEFRIIEVDEDYIVLETLVLIEVEAEGEFSLSAHDSIDNDYVSIGSTSASTEESFESNILITIIGDLNGDIGGLDVDRVEIVNPITSIDFGTIEPDFE